MTLLIKNGHVLDPATETDEEIDIFIEDGKITKRGKKLKCKAERVIDAAGSYVMPGFIDLHVHLRDPGYEEKETIASGVRAAAKGGYTTILMTRLLLSVVKRNTSMSISIFRKICGMTWLISLHRKLWKKLYLLM